MKHHSHKPKPDMTNREMVPPPPAPPGRQEPGTEPFSFLRAFSKKKPVSPLVRVIRYFVNKGYKEISFKQIYTDDYITITLVKQIYRKNFNIRLKILPDMVNDIDDLILAGMFQEAEEKLNNEIKNNTDEKRKEK